VDSIRIVLAGLPRMLAEILTAALDDEPDVELVGKPPDLEALKAMVARHEVDVVILGLSDDALSPAQFQLFDADARVRILALEQQGRSASLYELRPYRTMLGEGSPQELMQTVRAQVRSGTAWGRG
jgi:hypothetical protein